MAEKLVIVESPAKARTIGKILGKDFNVKASLGHVRDLPQYRFGVNVANDFEPAYEVPKRQKKTVQELAKAARGASAVYLATDPDREGEAISWHLLEASNIKGVPVSRVVFHEITRSAITEAFDNPREIDMDLVDAQQARRILDRVVGYRLSPLLWHKLEKGLSAGRVQSAALRMVSDREAEITAFIPTEYWTLEAALKKQGNDKKNSFQALLYNRKGKRGKLAIPDEETSKAIADSLADAAYTVSKVDKKQTKRQPAPPFTTSTLQQEAGRKLRFTAKKTMALAQQLYEGLSIGSEGQVGLITYMRTDSPSVSNEARSEARRYISEKFGAKYVPTSPRAYKARAKAAQEAHEAIRPTSCFRDPDDLQTYLDKDQMKLYELIWKRMIASQMSAALIDQTTVHIEAENREIDASSPVYMFRATGSVTVFAGFLTLYHEDADDPSDDKQVSLPDLSPQEVLDFLALEQKQHFTQPPPRYTEASLIKALEENGIGRPSTYAPTLSTIQDRKYIRKERGRIHPTELGLRVNGLLNEHFPDIVDLGFTAEMEREFDEISRGERGWVPVIRDFYEPFQEAINKAFGPIPEEINGLLCDICGEPMEVKFGRTGRFLGCSDYPKCKNAKPIPGDDTEETDIFCEKCERPMVIKVGRYGRFLSCTGYPECKNARPLPGEERQEPEETSEICEKCERPMVIRDGRRGKFLSCSGYPECKTARPLPGEEREQPQETDEVCDKCESPMVIRSGRRGKFLACTAYPKCKNTRPLPGEEREQPQETDEVCDKCESPMVIRSGRRGKFLACTAYPKCKNTRPLPGEQPRPEPELLDEACEKCGKPLAIKVGRRGKFIACTGYPKCKNARPLVSTKPKKEPVPA